MADELNKDELKTDVDVNSLKHRSQRSVMSEYLDEDVQKVHKELKERLQDKRKKDKSKNKEQEPEVKVPGEKLGFKFRFKRWWFGMDKEVKRMSWPTSKQLITNFLIVIAIVGILTALFFGINQIFISAGILS